MRDPCAPSSTASQSPHEPGSPQRSRCLSRRATDSGFPRSRSLGGGLHELRITHPEGPFRLIYGYRPGRRIVLVQAFVKRTEQTPADALRLARDRFADVERREGGK